MWWIKDFVKQFFKLSTKKVVSGTVKSDHEETPMARARSETILSSLSSPSLSTASLTSLVANLSVTDGTGKEDSSAIFEKASDSLLLM